MKGLSRDNMGTKSAVRSEVSRASLQCGDLSPHFSSASIRLPQALRAISGGTALLVLFVAFAVLQPALPSPAQAQSSAGKAGYQRIVNAGSEPGNWLTHSGNYYA